MPEIAFLLMLLFYAFMLFIVWKFYQVLSRINDNLYGIGKVLEDVKEAVERSGRPESKLE